MQLTVFPDYAALSEKAADEMVHLLQQKPDAVICMASGSSPSGCCASFTRKVNTAGMDISRFFFVGLDEWVGLTPGMPGSCAHDFMTRLFEPLHIPPAQYHLFDTAAQNLAAACAEMDAVIAARGGIDLMIVGIGLNGHIGFNEPGVDTGLLSHVIDLDATTVAVGQQKYFSEPVVLKQGITLGLGHLQAARKVILLANGGGKAEVVQRAAEGPVIPAFPASIMQQLPQGCMWVDAAAAALLKK